MQQPRPLEPRLLSRAMRLVSGLHLEAEGAAHTFCSQSWETLHLLARPPSLPGPAAFRSPGPPQSDALPSCPHPQVLHTVGQHGLQEPAVADSCDLIIEHLLCAVLQPDPTGFPTWARGCLHFSRPKPPDSCLALGPSLQPPSSLPSDPLRAAAGVGEPSLLLPSGTTLVTPSHGLHLPRPGGLWGNWLCQKSCVWQGK